MDIHEAAVKRGPTTWRDAEHLLSLTKSHLGVITEISTEDWSELLISVGSESVCRPGDSDQTQDRWLAALSALEDAGAIQLNEATRPIIEGKTLRRHVFGLTTRAKKNR
jgi:hypothetical protein